MVGVSTTVVRTYRVRSGFQETPSSTRTRKRANGMADEIKCQECGLNIAFMHTGGVYTCAPCELKRLGIKPTYIPYKKRPYQKRGK